MTPMWLLITAHLIVMTSGVTGNGRLWEPPGRSTMWRRGFNTPVNNNDDQVFCGELGSLGYKCGVCGDPYDGERLNEEGGLYATGLISRSYQQGQLVSIQVEVTTSRYGWFDFRLCPKSSSDEKTTQECLDQYLLPIDGGLGTKYLLPRLFTGTVNVNVRLPPGLTCDYCVLQWTYHIGYRWGQDIDETGCIGCGYSYADVSIVPGGTADTLMSSFITTAANAKNS